MQEIHTLTQILSTFLRDSGRECSTNGRREILHNNLPGCYPP